MTPPQRIALTGTPGVGKSSVARTLAPHHDAYELGELAVALGAGKPRGSEIVIDLPMLRRKLARWSPNRSPAVLVGYLSHRLPVDRAIVLRCHPGELGRRLRRARRGTAEDQVENQLAEATDVVLVDAIARVADVVEIDTTGRTVSDVARSVERAIRGILRAPPGRVDWLSDPLVTDHLLDPSR